MRESRVVMFNAAKRDLEKIVSFNLNSIYKKNLSYPVSKYDSIRRQRWLPFQCEGGAGGAINCQIGRSRRTCNLKTPSIL